MPTDTSAVVEQHDEVVEEIAEMCDEVFGGDTDADDLSDDAFLQLLREASEACGLAGIESTDRPEVITAAFRRHMIRDAEKRAQNIGYQIEMMFSL